MNAQATALRHATRASGQSLEWWLAATLPVASAVIGFVWILGTQLRRLFGLTAPAWDLATTQQVVWSLSAGQGWSSSFDSGNDFLGIHMEPVLLLIAAIEKLWPSPVGLLVISAIGLAATAPAAFLMLRAMLPDHPARTWLALALSIPMPFWAATQGAAAFQFHPENIALALAMLAAWAGLTGRHVALYLLSVLVLTCKEDQTYTAFVIGLLVWRLGTPEFRAHGRNVMLLAAAWLVLGVGLLEFLIRGAGYSPDTAYYWWIINRAEPDFFLQAVSRPDAWLVLGGVIVGLLGLPLAAPRWFLLVVPPLLADLMSSHDPQERLQLHYALIILFPLVVAAGFGGRRLLRGAWPSWVDRRLLLAGALPALLLGLIAGHLPPGSMADPWLYTRPAAVARLLAATSVIPSDAPVYADDGAAVWLANRVEIETLPPQLDPAYYVVIDREDWNHRDDPSQRAAVIAMMPATGRHLLVDDGRFEVWSPAG